MSITDELRDCIRTASRSYEDLRNPYNDREILHISDEELLAIADRIDAEHKAKVDEAYENGERDERADWLDETDGGYIKLPVDADGVPIRVGDYVETLIEAFKGERGRVECLTLTEDGWCVDGDEPSTVRHVQPDSWERIIEDAVKNGMYDHDNERIQQKLVERCRRLAGAE